MMQVCDGVGIDREAITVLLKVIFTQIVVDLHQRSTNLAGQEAGAIQEVANAIDNVCIEYHVHQLDEYVRQANEDSS